MTITLDAYVNLAPKDVEIWTSPDSAIDHFTKATAQSLDAKEGDQTITFDPVECRYVKLRIVSGASPTNIEIAEVRVTEASRAGYVALAARNPDVATWPRSPRQAAQLGLDWLQQSAVEWQGDHKCFGCHVQAQVIMGQAVAMKHDYAVNRASFDALVKGTREYKGNDGSWFNQSLTATQYAAMSLAYADDATGRTEDPDLIAGVDGMVTYRLTPESTTGAVRDKHDDGECRHGIGLGRPAHEGPAVPAGRRPRPRLDRRQQARDHAGSRLQDPRAHGLRHGRSETLVTPLVEQLLTEQQRTAAGWSTPSSAGRTRFRRVRCCTRSSRPV